MTEKTLLIQKQNDVFRKTLMHSPKPDHGVIGKHVLTEGIVMLRLDKQLSIIEAVVRFSGFSEDNDPYEEHDFGSLTFEGQKIYWKIDYYDVNYEYGSEDPSDLNQTRRVLTIMLAQEY